MKYIYNRVIAYVIDMLVVVVIATLLSRVSFINPEVDNYNKYNELYSDFNINYQSYVSDLEKYYGNNEISEKEYDKLVKKYDDISSSLVKYYDDKEITDKEYNKIVNETNKTYMKQNKKLYFNLCKYSLVYNIIVLVCLVLYFVVFNIVTNGQTLGKKLFGLQIVSVDDGNVTKLNYVIRFLILYFPIYYLAVIIGPFVMNVNNFYTLGLIFSSIKNYLNVAIIMFVLFRNDKRGLHDLVSHTKVIDLNTKEKDLSKGKKKVNAKKKNDLDVEVIREKKKVKSKKNKKIIVDNEEN